MKKLPFLFMAVAGFCGATFGQVGPVPGCPGAFGPTKIIQGTTVLDVTPTIAQNTTWSNDTIYIIKDFVHVGSGSTLTIEAGTIMMGFPTIDDVSVLIIDKGAKMISQGTALAPVVMTSCKLQGTRNRGDWGGLVICGNAPNPIGYNIPLTPRFYNQLSFAYHGGNDLEDNSGTYQYMRIEFAGKSVYYSSESFNGYDIDGITLGSVGAKTIFQFIEVSNSGNDSFKWFGGNVNGRNLLSFKSLDDDFDTNIGYSGINQFGISYKDYSAAHYSGSFAFESENRSSNSIFPVKAIFSNFSCFGPLLTSTSPYNNYHRGGVFLSRNTEQDIYNSVFIGFPGDIDKTKPECSGVLFNSNFESNNALSGLVRFKKNTVVAYNSRPTSSAFSYNFDASGWFATGSFANTFGNGAYAVISQYKAPLREDPLFALNPGSALLTGSSFTTTGLTEDLPLGFVFAATPAARGFISVAYRGATAGTEWANDTWTEYNPNLFKYTAGLPTRQAVAEKFLSGNGVSDLNTIAISPNPAVERTTISFFMDYATSDATLSVLDMSGNPIFVQNANIFAGENKVEMNTQNLNPGVYIVRLSANGTTAKTAKLNVVR